jgi:hypothetical protein
MVNLPKPAADKLPVDGYQRGSKSHGSGRVGLAVEDSQLMQLVTLT